MALGFSLSHDLERIERNIHRAGISARPELVRAMERSVIATEADLKRNGLTGSKGRHPFWGITGASGDTLGARSGHTRQSVTARTFTAGPVVIGTVGVPGRAFAMHEKGGTVTGNPYLRLPTAAAQTGAGVDRWLGQSARNIPGAFLLKSQVGNLWIVQRIAGVLVQLYLLKRSITVKARHVLEACYARVRPTVNANFFGVGVRVAATVTGR